MTLFIIFSIIYLGVLLYKILVVYIYTRSGFLNTMKTVLLAVLEGWFLGVYAYNLILRMHLRILIIQIVENNNV